MAVLECGAEESSFLERGYSRGEGYCRGELSSK